MIKKVISGGQTGADQGGLYAAKMLGIDTGGWAPRGWLTSEGPEPRLGSFYGLKENDRPGYPARTYSNARDSDGTIRLAFNFNSPGEKCTLKAIQQYNKPYFDVNLNNTPPINNVVDWLTANNIEILNIAGNAEKHPPHNIFKLTFNYIYMVLVNINMISF